MSDIPRIVIGIDPGESGGIAYVGDGIADAVKFPETEQDTYEHLYWLISENEAVGVYLEAVHSMPKQGVSSSFKFGANYGFYRGLLTALPVRWQTVTPQKWQKAMGCRTSGDKNVSKAAAQRLFPAIAKMTHAKADALLIAEYGWRVENGKPT